MKPQAEPVHSPFTKRQPYQPSSTGSSIMDAFLQDKTMPPHTTSSSLPQSVPTTVNKPSGLASAQQNSSGPADPQASSPLPLQQHKLKQQKKRASITTKVIYSTALKSFYLFSPCSIQFFYLNVIVVLDSSPCGGDARLCRYIWAKPAVWSVTVRL